MEELAADLTRALVAADVPSADIPAQVDLLLDMMVPEATFPAELQEPPPADLAAEPSVEELAADLTRALVAADVPSADIPAQVDLLLDMMVPEATLPAELQEPPPADLAAEPSVEELAADLTRSLAAAGVPSADISAQVDLLLEMMVPDTSSLSSVYPEIRDTQ
ncbi:MAG: hypothetical protein FJZ47_03100 [Candidatus Tectomicrobia bacterium]|uniref:Uncharacterized protein n=1 Tax=Tectimicrobiota bacterium TaxID=2528274 RepID=A0A938B2F6_UNCTE|nr:hypothetical protein [Candidatus Tectomicrobia bacterium]